MKPEEIRRAWEEQHPDQAAAMAARRFEMDAISIPADIQDADAGWFYRHLVMAGPAGLSLTELRGKGIGFMGQSRGDQAVSVLRRSHNVVESEERTGISPADRIVIRARR